MAVEWRMPHVERWAVAWLMATGGSHLRLRWSSRARDGRFWRETLAPHPITSMTAGPDGVVLGLRSGEVNGWSNDGELHDLPLRLDRPVSAVAIHGHRLIASGPANNVTASPWSAPVDRPPSPSHELTTAAAGPGGEFALGDTSGRVLLWRPGETRWTPICAERGDEIRALAVAAGPAAAVRVVWAGGEVGDYLLDTGTWRHWHDFGATVTAAAWNHDGAKLAAVIGSSSVRFASLRAGAAEAEARELLVPTHGQETVRSVAWSGTDVLGVATADRIYHSAGPVSAGAAPPFSAINCDEEVDLLALPGPHYAVTARRDRLVQWELSVAGSDDPTFADDTVTTIGIRPGDRRLTLAGTGRGKLQLYDATGVADDQIELEGRPNVKQLAWYAQGGYWLAATTKGLYKYWPDGPDGRGRQARQTGGFCLLVAVGGGRFAYAISQQVKVSDGYMLQLSDSVDGLRMSSRGTVAAVSVNGQVQLQQPEAAGVVLRKRHQHDPRKMSQKKPRVRLIDVEDRRVLLYESGQGLRWTSLRGTVRFGRPPDGVRDGVRFDEGRAVLLYRDQGVLLTGNESSPPSWAAIRARSVAVSTGRIAVAMPYHVAGYDVLDSSSGGVGTGTVNLAAEVASGPDSPSLAVTLPGGDRVQVSLEQRKALVSRPPGNRASGGRERAETADDQQQTVNELSDAVFQAAQVGDVLWEAGLGLAVDHARGPDPDRPVRLRWTCPAGPADQFPFELLRPSAAELGWFGEPPTTMVRSVAPRPGAAAPQRLSAAGRSPVMCVVRGTDREFKAVDEAFDRFRRRTRRTEVVLAAAQPQPVDDLAGLSEVLDGPLGPPDVLQVWAHSDERRVGLSRNRPAIKVTDIADCIARTPPRLVVLVGCTSGALGRELVERGVTAAVAMRVRVRDRSVQPLVEDVTARVLTGTAVDLAFAAALRRYLFTGQPGAAAIPLLYLADGSDGVLFPERLDQPRAVRRT